MLMKQDCVEQGENKSAVSGPEDKASVPEFYPDEFREHVDDFDITEEQQIELLKALWSIAIACVDLGFGVDAMRLAIPVLAEFSCAEESGDRKTILEQFDNAATKTVENDGS